MSIHSINREVRDGVSYIVEYHGNPREVFKIRIEQREDPRHPEKGSQLVELTPTGVKASASLLGTTIYGTFGVGTAQRVADKTAELTRFLNREIDVFCQKAIAEIDRQLRNGELKLGLTNGTRAQNEEALRSRMGAVAPYSDTGLIPLNPQHIARPGCTPAEYLGLEPLPFMARAAV